MRVQNLLSVLCLWETSEFLLLLNIFSFLFVCFFGCCDLPCLEERELDAFSVILQAIAEVVVAPSLIFLFLLNLPWVSCSHWTLHTCINCCQAKVRGWCWIEVLIKWEKQNLCIIYIYIQSVLATFIVHVILDYLICCKWIYLFGVFPTGQFGGWCVHLLDWTC